MVELRKRKEPPAPTAATTKASPAAKRTASESTTTPASPSESTSRVKVGDVIDIDRFGGSFELHDGSSTTFKNLFDDSSAGVVLFTYPKASTPGCTTQVCLFRDSYKSLTDRGLAVYGLSRDSAKANTTFKTKQNLPYSLICDPTATLIKAIGLKNGDKTQRGVFVVDKSRKVLVAEPGGPAATLQAVQAVLGSLQLGKDASGDADTAKHNGDSGAAQGDAKNDHGEAAVAAEVADSAENLDK